MRHMLAVVPLAVLVAACGAPEAAPVPVAPAAAVAPVKRAAPTSHAAPPTSPPLGVVPVDTGPGAARETAARVAAQAGAPPGTPAPRRRAAPTPAPRPATRPVVQPAPKPAPPTSGPAGGCNENYSPCVPNDSDVDCQGGSGNGPSYVAGPVRVTGTDVYGLDADHDGIGCE